MPVFNLYHIILLYYYIFVPDFVRILHVEGRQQRGVVISMNDSYFYILNNHKELTGLQGSYSFHSPLKLCRLNWCFVHSQYITQETNLDFSLL